MTYFREDGVVTASDADGDARIITLRAPAIAAAARPFQFVMVRVPEARFTLRRPVSIFDANGEEVILLIKKVGAGSARLGALAPGEHADVVGPLGRPWTPPAGAAYVAGGVGIAGLFFALAEAARRHEGARLFFGARSADGLYAASRLAGLGVDVTFTTEDGSRGERGVVTDFVPAAALAVVACGPRPMYRALTTRVSAETPCYVLMEEHMACGVGACRGCAVPAVAPAGSYIAACRDGPLVDARAVAWDRVEDRI